MTDPTDDGAIIDRLFQALTEGDVAGARACCIPDAVFWHGYDRLEMTLDEISQTWRDLVGGFTERRFVEVRRAPFGKGYAQRLELHVGTGEQRMGWALAIFVEIRDGRISRFDEYIDRAGVFTPGGTDG